MYSKIAKVIEGFDQVATADYYKNQLTAKENCSCLECEFYQDVFIKKDLQIFSFLSELGIDIRKGEDIDPEGLWMILDERNELLVCYCTFAVFGNFSDLQEEELHFEYTEQTVQSEIQIHVVDEQVLLLFIEFHSV